jgi:OmpA-OmpF porin, OOP family
MTRSSIPLILAGALAACSESTPPAPPEPTPTEAAPTVNETRSVMREAVIAEIKPTPPPVVEPQTLPTATIGFARGTALGDEGRAALDTLLADAALPKGARFLLRGHSDAMGSDADNLTASRRRAQAVAAYLNGKGIDAERIEVIALGERRPVSPNAKPDGSDDPEGRARNRRVEVEVVAPAPPAPEETSAQAAGGSPSDQR